MPINQDYLTSIEHIISQLNELGRSYLARQQQMNFFKKTFGGHKNDPGAIALQNLSLETINSEILSPSETRKIQKIKNVQHPDETLSNAVDRSSTKMQLPTDLSKWENENLPTIIELGLKLLNYLEKIVRDSHKGSTFIPGILHILNNCPWRLTSSEQPKATDAGIIINLMKIKFMGEMSNFLIGEIEQVQLKKQGFYSGYNLAREQQLNLNNESITEQHTEQKSSETVVTLKG